MHLRTLLRTIAATILITVASLSDTALAASTQTDNSQPANSPGLAVGFLSTTGLTTGSTIGGAAASFASGGQSGLAGLDVRRFALSETGAAGAPGGKNWNAWVGYSHSNVAYTYAPLDSSGHVNVYLVGADYTFDNNIVFGVAVAADRTSVDQNFSGGKLDGRGTTIAPYIGYAINRNWVVDGTVGFGRTTVDTNVGGVTGSGKDDRTIGTLGVSYRHVIDQWQLTGRGALLSVHDKLGAYTLSNGTLVPDGTVNLTQVRLIGQVAYSAGTFTPYASLSYVRDLRRPDQAAIGPIAAANDRDAWTPAIGVRFRADNTFYGSIQYSTERARSEVRNDQFLINVGIRF
jgi:hypothetical protein